MSQHHHDAHDHDTQHQAEQHEAEHHRAVQQPHGAIRDRGQATTEYALVLLGAALVGVLVIGWATAGGGAAAIGRLFESVIDAVIEQV